MTRRLLLSYLSVTVLVLVALEVPLAIFYRERELDRLTADVERDATVLASIYEDALEKGTPADPTSATDYTGRTRARVVVTDADGISLVDTGAGAGRDFSTRPEFEVALTGRRSVGTRHSETLGTDLLYVSVPVASGGTVHGAVRLTLDTHEVDELIQRFWVGLVAVGLVVLVTVAAIGWGIARWVTRPVRRLQATAERFSRGDLATTTPDRAAPPEVVALEAAMNTMAGRLERLLDQQRQFVADASHQLRTPLTALRLRLDNLRSSTDEPHEAEELERAIDETDRLATLVGDLLHLARAEESRVGVPCDVVSLARDRVDTWGAIAEQMGVVLELDGPTGPVWALAVPGAVEQILDNLVDNAVDASAPGSTVTVAVDEDGPAVRLSIRDEGPGLDPEQRSRAVERFWRADRSAPGSGLGLAIVQNLVVASGGSLSLDENAPSGGLEATVALRPAPAPVPDRARAADTPAL